MNENECCFCYVGDGLVEFPCQRGHFIHMKCYREWCAINKNVKHQCFLCREEFDYCEDNIVRIILIKFFTIITTLLVSCVLLDLSFYWMERLDGYRHHSQYQVQLSDLLCNGTRRNGYLRAFVCAVIEFDESIGRFIIKTRIVRLYIIIQLLFCISVILLCLLFHRNLFPDVGGKVFRKKSWISQFL